MDHRLSPKQENEILEDALKNYPLAPMPHSITVNIMARIQKDVRPTLVTWNDFILSLVIALCIGALFFTVQNLPTLVLTKIRIQSILFYQDLIVNARWLVPALFFGMVALLSSLTLPALITMTKRNK